MTKQKIEILQRLFDNLEQMQEAYAKLEHALESDEEIAEYVIEADTARTKLISTYLDLKHYLEQE